MTVQDIKDYIRSLKTPPQLIRRGHLYSAAELSELQKLYEECNPKSVFFRLLETKTDRPFIIEKTCRAPKESLKKRSGYRNHEGCGGREIVHVGRGEIESYLRGEGHSCISCKEQEELRNKRRYEAMGIEKSHATTEYINTICNPEYSWNEATKLGDMWRAVHADVYQMSVESHLKTLAYGDFLKTPYWKAIAQKVRQRANWRCQMCNTKRALEVHHRSYDCHGREHDNLGDLIAICRECHGLHHGKEVAE